MLMNVRDRRKGKRSRNENAWDKACFGSIEATFSGVSCRGLYTGNFVRFGHFKQGKDDNQGAAPVEWLVLEKRWDEVLLISRHSLAGRRFHDKPEPISWAGSGLRAWLNHEFLNTAFSAEERRDIRIFSHEDDFFGEVRTVSDYIFCLSISEACRYFRDDESRQCLPTEYARLCYGTEIWMLRSPGAFPDQVATVNSDGSVYSYGWNASEHFSVRPALWLSLRIPDNSEVRTISS